MTRWKAAAIHLSISVVIGLVAGALLFGVWYPPPYFHAGGADELILLLVGVDLTIGPLLTLIVFRSGKRGLTFDLSVIGILQTAALVYGLHVVLESRPIFLVAVPDRFEMIAADQIEDRDLALGDEAEFRSRSWSGPRLVAAIIPDDPQERSDLAFSALDGRDVPNLPKYYRPYGTTTEKLLKNAQPLDTLRKRSPQAEALVAAWLAKSGRSADSVVWLPLTSRKADMSMLIDAKTAAVVQPLPIDPW